MHFEIPVDDEVRAQKFYRETFGWDILPMPEMQYTMVGTTPSDKNGIPTEVGAINGGMMKRQGPFKGPVVTISVEEITTALENVRKNGGSVITEKQPVGDMGFIGYFTDTEGNLIGLYQNARS